MSEETSNSLAGENELLRRAMSVFNPGELFHFDVPEWPDEQGAPTRIFYRRITLSNKADMARFTAQDGAALALARIFCLLALDEEGSALVPLALSDTFYKRIDPEQLSRLVVKLTQPPKGAVSDPKKS